MYNTTIYLFKCIKTITMHQDYSYSYSLDAFKQVAVSYISGLHIIMSELDVLHLLLIFSKECNVNSYILRL